MRGRGVMRESQPPHPCLPCCLVLELSQSWTPAGLWEQGGWHKCSALQGETCWECHQMSPPCSCCVLGEAEKGRECCLQLSSSGEICLSWRNSLGSEVRCCGHPLLLTNIQIVDTRARQSHSALFWQEILWASLKLMH